MNALLATITALSLFGSTPQAPEAGCPRGHAHSHQHQIVVSDSYMARAASYRAVCSRGDLNSVFSSRGAALKAAAAHQRSTGHRTSVQKQ